MRPGRRLFRLALRLLAPRFRDRAADEMRVTYDARMREARAEGLGAAARAWAIEMGGALGAVVRSRLDGRGDGVAGRLGGGAGGSVPQDLRFAFRTFRRRPLPACLAIATCGVGIGSAAAMFSVVDGVLLKPVDFPEPDRLVSIYTAIDEWRETSLAHVWDRVGFAQPEFLRWRDRQTSFSEVAAVGSATRYVEGPGAPANALVGIGSAGLWRLADVRPVLGRVLTREDGLPGAEPVTLLTWDSWRSRFGGADVVGERLRLSDEERTIVGVLPADFRVHGYEAEAWIPLPEAPIERERGNHNYLGLGRLAPGVDIERAREETRALLRPLSDLHGDITHSGNVVPYLADVTRSVRTPLRLLLLGSLLLLGAACFNFAALLLGAGLSRERELAVRGALGAGRRRLGRLLLTESLVLALLGGALGVVLAVVISKGLVLLAPPDVPRIDEVAVDVRALGFALSMALLAGLGFGLVPAWSLSRADVANRLRSRSAPGDRGRLYGALVLGQIALATVLLVGAGLLVRTLVHLDRVDPGIDTDVLAVRVSLPPSLLPRDPDAARAARTRFEDELLATLEAVPGVERVARTSVLPFWGESGSNDLSLEGYEPAPGEQLVGQRRFTSGGYMEVMGFRPIEGRLLTADDDRDGAERVAVVSRRLAGHAWPDGSAVGRHLEFWAGRYRIVGVVEDVHDRQLEADTELRFYVPYAGADQTGGSWVLRVSGDPRARVESVRAALRRAWPRLPEPTVVPVEELVYRSLAERRFRARLAGVFAILALFFASAGIYGVVSRRVGLRRREIGVRLALGASPPRVLGEVLRQGAGLALAGCAAGLLLSALGARALSAYVYGVSALDPSTFGAIALLLLGAALLASFAPSVRAARVDPMEILRGE